MKKFLIVVACLACAACEKQRAEWDNVEWWVTTPRATIEQMVRDKTMPINASGCHGYTPLMYAVSTRGLDVIKMLVVNGATLVQRNEYGQTPMLVACQNNNKSRTIEYLLEVGADINATDNEGRNCLITAILNENYDIVDTLVEYGIDINRPDNNGETAATYAPEYYRTRILIGE
ncbi:MAG: ankyrin repeat domain-containing protein [Alphaproteobacteria bacterium]|nr:ankyrin repeat domain-containing protein [Alphaproteobacteria bacterium]